jgi:hypothetical protein
VADETYSGRSELQLRFDLRGPNLSPDAVTTTTGVEPSRTRLQGEHRGRMARANASWSWSSDWTHDFDTNPLFEKLCAVLGPTAREIRVFVDDGASATLTVVGQIYGIVISTSEEADLRGYYTEPDDAYLPFFAGDRVGISLSRATIEFLAVSGATFATHVDADLDREWLQDHSSHQTR